MLCLEESCTTAAGNLALDEALLELAERGSLDDEVLRLWTPPTTFVVVGRSGRVAEEVELERTARDGIPVLRRSSGGGTVVAAKGCQFYALLLSLKLRPELRMLDTAHRFVMSQLVEALQPLEPRIAFRGTSDLCIGQRKIGGNSLRVRRDWALYHGTLLLNMDLSLVERYLRHPPREPLYREGRRHSQFLANLHLSAASITTQLRKQFAVSGVLKALPLELVARLQSEKYESPAWNLQR